MRLASIQHLVRLVDLVFGAMERFTHPGDGKPDHRKHQQFGNVCKCNRLRAGQVETEGKRENDRRKTRTEPSGDRSRKDCRCKQD